jgi:SPX domain protein involved in polyphosphate accumulation/uncharacterized membrane protein YidH (DUF202 family)
MKFGEYIVSETNPEWAEYYLNYKLLKDLIKILNEKVDMDQDLASVPRGTSLSVPLPTNAAAQIDKKSKPRKERSQTIVDESSPETQEGFYRVLEGEMKKIELFSKKKVKEFRSALRVIDSETEALNSEAAAAKSNSGSVDPADNAKREALKQRTMDVGKEFLKLEKYVNLNFMAFHKILKKHDKWLPNPCKAFYLARLHDQGWVRGDYSDVIVSMSSIYGALRGDEKVEGKDSESQNFVRSTRKYWVHTEDVSKVKYMILQHLPVYLQKDESGEVMSVDSQLVNSVYTDNYAMELYHGRLEKSAGAIALRFRWYGTGLPTKVFIERKTHREAWAGDISVKERFVVDEDQVLPLLKGNYDVHHQTELMRKKGKKEDEIAEWLKLASEICNAIVSKQLMPVMRTQYMRTAFQIPFDATVRISLDSNLTMIVDRTKETANFSRWYRDPSIPVPLTEITRFPHAILEVKLQLLQEGSTPTWVTDMINSGMLMEVHKFSKFIHGCAVLLPEEVRAVPYWIDDSSLKDSIVRSGAGDILTESTGANMIYHHLLPHDSEGNSKVALEAKSKRDEQKRLLPIRFSGKTNSFLSPSIRSGAAGMVAAVEQSRGGPDYQFQDGYLQEECMTCEWAQQEVVPRHIVQQKVEPKLHFANERTFIKWLHMAVILSSISIGVLAFTEATSQAQDYAVFLLPISLLFVGYALATFLWRSQQITTRSDLRWDDPMGPVILTSLLILALTSQFVLKLWDIWIHGMSTH